jgi:hypothetical protein
VRSKDTGDDFLDLSGAVQNNVQRRSRVILAMGAIESARMALLAPGAAAAPNGGLIGNNLMVHLRKNSQFYRSHTRGPQPQRSRADRSAGTLPNQN